MALPAFAAERRRPGRGKAAHALAATTGQTDGHPTVIHRPRSALYTRAVPIRGCDTV